MPARPVDLCTRIGIDPRQAGNVFWMVELMEAWFLADPDALAAYYGDGFLRNAIGNSADVERVPKLDVVSRLKQATRSTTRGVYDKVKHAPHLLERLDGNRVRLRAEHCRQLFESVVAKLGQAEN